MSLDMRDVSLSLGEKQILCHVSLTVQDGERIGLIGSSGSGKSMLLHSILGILPQQARLSGSLLLGNKEMIGAGEEAYAAMRGRYVGMVFQQPSAALNPIWTVYQQVSLPLRLHYELSKDDIQARVAVMLKKVGLSPDVMHQYTYELSGGQQQRVGIAAALITAPKLIVADEPTTALDSLTQCEVLALLTSLVDDMGASLLMVTHDFSVLARSVSRCYVMDNGAIVEANAIHDLLSRPKHPSTQTLVSAAKIVTLGNDRSGEERHVQAKHPHPQQVCALKHVCVDVARDSCKVRVLNDIALEIQQGELVGIIGSSGAGKTTLLRTILGLQTPVQGEVYFQGQRVDNRVSWRTSNNGYALLRRHSAMIFQHPLMALDPRWSVRRIVAEPLQILASKRLTKDEVDQRVCDVLQLVGLNALEFIHRYPHELSGGQAQLVALARALISQPQLLIADEPMSAIDVAERVNILRAFQTICRQRPAMALLIVSHDLGVVEHLVQRVVVLDKGRIVESGSVARILQSPQADYTKQLVQAARCRLS